MSNEQFSHFIQNSLTQEGRFERLPEGEVHVWVTSIDRQIGGILSASELARCKKMKSSLARKQFEVARKTLRYLVSYYLTLSQEDVIFETSARGKPFVSGCTEFFFNIAHSKGFIVLAFSRHSIGVDLELIRPVHEIALASRVFDPGELALLKALPQEEREQRFFQLWTAKEAALKADGRGIANGLKRAISHFEKESVSSIDFFRNSTDTANSGVAPVLDRIVSLPSTTTCGRLDECGVGLEFGLGQYEAYSPASKSFVRLASSVSTPSRNDGDEISDPGASNMLYTLNSCAPSTPCTSSVSASLERSLIHLDGKNWCINSWTFSNSNQHFLGAIATPFSPIVIRWHNMVNEQAS